MASQIQSPRFFEKPGRPAGPGIPPETPLSRISIPRCGVAIGILCGMAISTILLARRWSGAFVVSLPTLFFLFALSVAGGLCIASKWLVATTKPELSRRANGTFICLVCATFLLFLCAIAPQSWNGPETIGTLGLCTLVGWFCVAPNSVPWTRNLWNQFVLPICVEFLGQPALQDELGETSQPSTTVTTAPVETRPATSTDLEVAKTTLGIVSPDLLNSQHGEDINFSRPKSTSTTASQDFRSLRETDEQSDCDQFSPAADVSDQISMDGDKDSTTESVLKFADYSSALEDKGQQADSGQITSRFIRRIEANGDDVFEAHTAAVFAAGNRHAVLHVPFAPAFAVTPRVDCEVSDDSEVQLKVGTVFPYGVRLELKRSGTDLDELAVNIDVFAIHAVSR